MNEIYIPVFVILGLTNLNASTHGRDGKTNEQANAKAKTIYPLTYLVCGGYNYNKDERGNAVELQWLEH